MYTLALLGGLVNNLIVTFEMQFLAKPLGIRGLFYISAVFIIATIYLVLNFDERIDIERLDKKGLIVWGRPINDVDET